MGSLGMTDAWINGQHAIQNENTSNTNAKSTQPSQNSPRKS